MRRFSILCFLTTLIVLSGGCVQRSKSISAQSTDKSGIAVSKTILSMEGRGGAVTLGDKLQQAKKVFPPPKGAQIGHARNYIIFQREGWSWVAERPVEAFEVSLKKNKIVGIIKTVAVADPKSRNKLIEQTIRKVGKPTAKAEGETTSICTWDVKPNARFLIEMKQGFPGIGPMVMDVIGEQEELKKFNYRVDDLKATVEQMDMSAEAMKNLPKRHNANPEK